MTKLFEDLRTQTMRIVFTKLDGSRREGLFTLDPRKVPQTTGTRTNTNPNVLPVWDCDKLAWRSVDCTRVISAEPWVA